LSHSGSLSLLQLCFAKRKNFRLDCQRRHVQKLLANPLFGLQTQSSQNGWLIFPQLKDVSPEIFPFYNIVPPDGKTPKSKRESTPVCKAFKSYDFRH
jgi:hypothetical protein